MADVDVIWLDLANAYGLIRYAMRHSEAILFRIYNEVFDKEVYSQMAIGIPVGCTISPLLFVLAMEVSYAFFLSLRYNSGLRFVPLITTSQFYRAIGGESVLLRLEVRVDWWRMKIKPKKCRSLSMQRGQI